MNKRGQEQISQIGLVGSSVWKKLFLGLIILIVIVGAIALAWKFWPSGDKDCYTNADGKTVCASDGNKTITKPLITNKTNQTTPISNPTQESNYSENLSDVPYSYLLIDEEGPFDSLQEIVDLANQYHVPLTIAFWPGEVDYILQNQSRIDKVHEWQAQGHEMGIHNQECWEGPECWNGSTAPECGFRYQYGSAWIAKPTDIVKYESLVAPYTIKSGNPGCYPWIPKTWIYEGGGRPDGRNAIATVAYVPELEHNVYTLNLKGGYAAVPPCSGGAEKIAQYNTLNGNEIFGAGFHTADYTGGDFYSTRSLCLRITNLTLRLETFNTVDCSTLPNSEQEDYIPDKNQLLDYIKFIYEKDPEGKKRMTLSDIMEKYVLPNNLTMEINALTDSSNATIKTCSYLAYENITGWQTATSFNFGRCLHTGTYCDYSESYYSADNSLYCPNTCTVKNIAEFDKSGSLAGNCGNGNCDAGENKYCPSDCPGGSGGSMTYTCPNRQCETSLGETSTNCPGDCIVARE